MHLPLKVLSNGCRSASQLNVTRKLFSLSTCRRSGHNRWSKIRHDKGKNDANKNKERSLFARDIAFASKLFGPDPISNNRLQQAISVAKKAGFPKASIEAAVARGQGSAANGNNLESILIEAIIPPSIGVMIECQTDGKLRLMQKIKIIIKNRGGSMTPTGYLFERKGRILICKESQNLFDDVLELAIDSAALDVVESGSAHIAISTKPNELQKMLQLLSEKIHCNIESAEVIWEPIEDTKVKLEDKDISETLVAFIDELQEEPDVQKVYANISQGSLDNKTWDGLSEILNS